MGNIGFQNLLIILMIILVLFGAKKLPELAKGLGSGLREFKKAAKEIDPDDGKEELTTAQKSVSASEKTELK